MHHRGSYTGDIVFPTVGTYTLRLERDSRLAFYIDDVIRIPEWANTTSGFSAETTITTTQAAEPHRLRIDYGDTTGSAKLKLQWKIPGSSTWATVPGSSLRPGYGLVTSTVNANGTNTSVDYTDSGSGLDIVDGVPTAAVTDPGGLALTSSARYEVAGHRRPIADVMPSGDERSLTYYGDTETRDNPCTTASDPANQAGRQKLHTTTDPDGTGSATPIVNEAVYDTAGRPVAIRIGNESWSCATYDARGRIASIAYPAFGGSAARTVAYSYAVDPDGSGSAAPTPLLRSITDAVGAVVLEQNLAGDPVSHIDVFGNTTEFTYDQVGRQVASDGPAGTIETTYDSADRIASVTRDGETLADNLVYDSEGQLASVAYPSGAGNAGNGSSGAFGYDANGRPSSVTWSGPSSTTITSDVVTRDESDRIIDQTIDGTDTHISGDNFTYDAAGRLAEAWVPGAKYTYNFFENLFCSAPGIYKNTNRTQMVVTPTGGSPTSTAYCYDHADRLTAATDSTVGTIAYDAHGNTTSIFGETRTYDGADRHLSTEKSGTTVTYVRDAADRIVERKVNGVTDTRYGYTGSGDAPSIVTDGSGVLLSVTFALPGGAILEVASGTTSWSYPNLRGDLVATANSSGVKQGATRIYDPYGNMLSGPSVDNLAGAMDFGFLGEYGRLLERQAALQATVEMGARQYSPLLGRFLEVDPVTNGSCNGYEYVCGDPISNLDLSGTDIRNVPGGWLVRWHTNWSTRFHATPVKVGGIQFNRHCWSNWIVSWCVVGVDVRSRTWAYVYTYSIRGNAHFTGVEKQIRSVEQGCVVYTLICKTIRKSWMGGGILSNVKYYDECGGRVSYNQFMSIIRRGGGCYA